jgi:glycosyltransferase involved in cell wall biosynthesis
LKRREPRVALVDPGAFSPFYDHALCSALSARGASVELLTAPFAFHPWPAAEGYSRQEIFPASTAAPSREARAGTADGVARSFRRLRRALAFPSGWARLESRIARRPPDVLHLQWSPIPPLDRHFVARIAKRGVPVVVTAHNVGRRSDEPGSWLDRQPILALADRIVVHSESSAARLRELHPGVAPKIRRIPPGVEPPSRRDRAAARAELGLAAEEPVALFAGLIRPYKGVDLLLRAFARTAPNLPGARLVVAGLPRAREPFAAEHGADGRVRFELGYLPRDRFESYLVAADVVVLPYLETDESAVLGAALAADRPVVASRTGGLPETIGERFAEEMLVEPGDVDGLARALERRLADRALCERVGRAAGEEVRRRFRWETAADETLELYRECAAGGVDGGRLSSRPA